VAPLNDAVVRVRENQLMSDAPMAPLPVPNGRFLRWGFILEGVTLGWNAIGIVVLAVAAIAARMVGGRSPLTSGTTGLRST
jgi:hypothetical protein